MAVSPQSTNIHEVHHGQEELPQVHVAHLLRVVEGMQILTTDEVGKFNRNWHSLDLCMYVRVCIYV